MKNSFKFIIVFAFFSVLFFIYESEDASAQGSCACADRGVYPEGNCFFDHGENNCEDGYRAASWCPSKPLENDLVRCKRGGSCTCVPTCSNTIGASCRNHNECCGDLFCDPDKGNTCQDPVPVICTPGEKRLWHQFSDPKQNNCDRCGDQRYFCSDDGTRWVQGACVNRGPCNPNDRETRARGSGACREPENQERICDSNTCQWSDWGWSGVAGAYSTDGNSCAACGATCSGGTCSGSNQQCAWNGWQNTGSSCGSCGVQQQFCDGCNLGGTQCINQAYCGDNSCNCGENANSCYSDCGSCGDGSCNGPENAYSCYSDCGSCGDGICSGGENSNSCARDCGSCGDGVCSPEIGESCSSCGDCAVPYQGSSCGSCGRGTYDSCGNCNGDYSVCGSQGWKNTGNPAPLCGTEQRHCDGCNWGTTQIINQGECEPGSTSCSGDSVLTCSNSCSFQNSQNCNTQDGWYDTGQKQWVDSAACTQKEQKQEEFRDYTCGAGTCTFSRTQTRWTDTGATQNKPDGTSCDDSNTCTTDICQSGFCQGSPICQGTSASCGCTSCTNCDTQGTGAGRVGDGCLADGTYVDYQCSGTSCTSTTTPNDPRCQQCSGNACRDPINNPGERCDGFKWVKVDGQETGAACDDGIDNDCDSHTDRGDASCIRVKQAESPDTVLQGTNFEVLCTSTGISNCLGANVIGPNDYSRECQFTGWEQTPFDFIEFSPTGIRKIFNYYNHWRAKYTCYAENAGQFQVRCWLPNKPDGTCIVTGSPGEEGSPPGSGGDDNTTILPSECTERTQTECPQDGLCQWCSEPSCENTPGRFSVTAGTCIDISAACGNYACDADFDNNYIPDDPMCQAQCDDDTITCADTDCATLDGCYLNDVKVDPQSCFGLTGCEQRDYSNVANTCDTASTCGCSANACGPFTTQETDADADGYDTQCDLDCNDNNPNIYPNAPDCCSINEHDVNCDSIINPNCDKDGDGYIDANAVICDWE